MENLIICSYKDGQIFMNCNKVSENEDGEFTYRFKVAFNDYQIVPSVLYRNETLFNARPNKEEFNYLNIPLFSLAFYDKSSRVENVVLTRKDKNHDLTNWFYDRKKIIILINHVDGEITGYFSVDHLFIEDLHVKAIKDNQLEDRNRLLMNVFFNNIHTKEDSLLFELNSFVYTTSYRSMFYYSHKYGTLTEEKEKIIKDKLIGLEISLDERYNDVRFKIRNVIIKDIIYFKLIYLEVVFDTTTNKAKYKYMGHNIFVDINISCNDYTMIFNLKDIFSGYIYNATFQNTKKYVEVKNINEFIEDNIKEDKAEERNNSPDHTSSLNTILSQLSDKHNCLSVVPESKLNWNDYFYNIAFLSSFRSKDPKTKVGCCIVNDSNRILSIGYNGLPNNCDESFFPWTRSESMMLDKNSYIVHAELNAILNATTSLQGSKMYVTHYPCNECMKAIIQAGIKEVYYFNLEDKNHLDRMFCTERLAYAAGVKLERIKDVKVFFPD